MAGVPWIDHSVSCVFATVRGMAVSEMMSSNPKAWKTSSLRSVWYMKANRGIRSVQIAGRSTVYGRGRNRTSPIDHSKSSISIWVVQPKKWIRSLRALPYFSILWPHWRGSVVVVNAVDVPVTLKTRTGWDTDNRNCVQIAKIAEDCGIQALALHGRTRACMYKGEAEYKHIKAAKQAVSIPVIANGDIDSPEKAKFVLEYTGADALMIGRPGPRSSMDF